MDTKPVFKSSPLISGGWNVVLNGGLFTQTVGFLLPHGTCLSNDTIPNIKYPK